MYEGLSSPNIHSPSTMSEYSQNVLQTPNATIWAGGTFLMTRPDSYPSKSNNSEVIYIGNIEELDRFQRNDRLAELGCRITFYKILNSGKNILPRILLDNARAIESSLVSSRATIGGSLCTKDFTTSFPGTLIALDASVEIKFVKKKRLHSKWMPLARLVDKNGRISLPPQGIISRIRIGTVEDDYQKFYQIGSFVLEPTESVAVAFISDWDMDLLINPHIAFTIPLSGICFSRDIDNILASLRFPLDESEFNSVEGILFTFIDSSFTEITGLQRARIKGILKDLFDDLNRMALTLPGDKETHELRSFT